MLNLSIVMLRLILLLSLLFQDTAISIASPQTGATVRGQVEILGGMDIPNFASAELAFGFADSADSWFTIQTFAQPEVDAPLAVWDTTSITDGDYNLRLHVTLQDGSFQDAIVTNLKIRNDLPEPAPTAVDLSGPTSSQVIPTDISVAPMLPSFPQPTRLPSNPAALTVPLVYSTFGRGALIALALFAAFSLLLRLRKD
jgi:hypothetical protein